MSLQIYDQTYLHDFSVREVALLDGEMENYFRIKNKIQLSDDNYNNVESENFLHILVHETPYVTLKIGFHLDHKKVAEIKH